MKKFGVIAITSILLPTTVMAGESVKVDSIEEIGRASCRERV